MQPLPSRPKSTTMSQEEFIQLFVLRAVSTSPSFGDDFSNKVAQATRAANQTWFTMSKQTPVQPMGSASLFDNQLMALAQYARFVNPLSKYIAQDSDDIWYSHEEEPVFNGYQWVSPSHNTLFPTQPASMYGSHCLLIDDILNKGGNTQSVVEDSIIKDTAGWREQKALLDLIRVAANEGYEYIAQDIDLMWYAYENLPRYNGNSWNPNGGWKELIVTKQMMPAAQSLARISDILTENQ